MRLHPQERLFVRPLHWTPRHVDLLSCSFIHTPRSDDEARLSPPPSPPNRNLNPSSSSSSETTKKLPMTVSRSSPPSINAWKFLLVADYHPPKLVPSAASCPMAGRL
ncbi:hypothetical protein LY78DRAFT_373282 [Colletotrichum sublineola]|nr:hypothetical protein LY78DRAFT_373282 [Colletotrichum sublineola]